MWTYHSVLLDFSFCFLFKFLHLKENKSVFDKNTAPEEEERENEEKNIHIHRLEANLIFLGLQMAKVSERVRVSP